MNRDFLERLEPYFESYLRDRDWVKLTESESAVE